MTIFQLLGLQCKHEYLSRPFSGRRVCRDCGHEQPHDGWAMTADDYHTVEHYAVSAPIKRVEPKRLLNWRKRA